MRRRLLAVGRRIGGTEPPLRSGLLVPALSLDPCFQRAHGHMIPMGSAMQARSATKEWLFLDLRCPEPPEALPQRPTEVTFARHSPWGAATLILSPTFAPSSALPSGESGETPP